MATNHSEARAPQASCSTTTTTTFTTTIERADLKNGNLFNKMATNYLIFTVAFVILTITSTSATSTSIISSPITTQSLQVNQYTRTTNDLLLDLREQMLVRSIKFDEHFRSLLSSTKVSLHNLFIDTYGMVYERNTEIFTEMFENLEQYYATGQIKLTRTMEEFFVRLYQKIFQVFNGSKSFNAEYLQCATEQLAHLKPFKEVPDKLMSEIRHVFVAARTFNQALNHGIDIIKHIISLGQPVQCDTMIGEKLLRNSSSKACPNFCEQVLTKCFGRNNLDMLNDHWRNYVVALNELAMKLSTSYDIETIIKSMDVQISEAIMNFQENGTNVSNQVFSVCGSATTHFNSLKPTSNRIGKRSPAVPHIVASPSGRSNRNVQPQQQSAMQRPFSLGSHLKAASASNIGARYAPSRSMHSDDSLSQDDLKPNVIKSPTIIDEIRSYMSSTKNFWSALPNAVCTNNRTLGSNGSNNLASNKKQPHLNQNCFSEQMSNVNVVSVDTRYRKELILQISRMDDMHAKILSAMKGIEIDWDNGSPSGPTNGRQPVAQLPTTTTTTTTTEAPDDEEIEESDDTTMDPGSGEDPFSEPEEDSTVDPLDADYPETDDEDQPQTESPTRQDQEFEFKGDKPNEPLVTISNDIDASAKEPQTSSSLGKLVISIQDQLLLVALLNVALVISMLSQLNLSFNQLGTTSRSRTR